MSIRLQGLSLAYRQGPTLHFPDLELPDGRGLLLRGASGSGKSSLLALLAGLLSPSAGRLSIDGVEPAALSPARRDAWRGASLGFVPQRLHLSPALTVRGNLSLPYLAAGLRPQAGRIEELVERLDLAGLLERRPHQLSLGQAQRVALARALLRGPALLLADEPTANLDDDSAAAVLDQLGRASREQGAVLIVATHDSRVDAALGGALERLQLAPTRRSVEAA